MTKGLLSEHGIDYVYHYAPLHYLVFIARSEALLSKPELRRIRYDTSHFRSTSRRIDEERGFGNYVHLSSEAAPPILKAKLRAGFPHFELRFAATHLEAFHFHLCRYNIAKARNPKTGKRPAPEGPATGRYHRGKHFPTAETPVEREALLNARRSGQMVEVLVPTKLPLPANTDVIFFDQIDYELGANVLHRFHLGWLAHLATNLSYKLHQQHISEVRRFLIRSEQDPHWRGNGLEFDRFAK